MYIHETIFILNAGLLFCGIKRVKRVRISPNLAVVLWQHLRNVEEMPQFRISSEVGQSQLDLKSVLCKGMDVCRRKPHRVLSSHQGDRILETGETVPPLADEPSGHH